MPLEESVILFRNQKIELAYKIRFDHEGSFSCVRVPLLARRIAVSLLLTTANDDEDDSHRHTSSK
jgi:hypothetical protein